MKIELVNTDEIVEVKGVPTRMWEGTTERGTRIYAFIALIGARDRADDKSLGAELKLRPQITYEVRSDRRLDAVTTLEGLRAVLVPMRQEHEAHQELVADCLFCQGVVT